MQKALMSDHRKKLIKQRKVDMYWEIFAAFLFAVMLVVFLFVGA